MAFQHGKNSYFEVDDSGGTSRNITAYIESIDFPFANADVAETSVFGSSNKTFLAGQKTGTFTISGPYDPTLDGYLEGIVGGAEGDYIYGPYGSTGGYVKYTGKCICTSYQITGAVGDAVKYTASFQLTGAQTKTTF